MLQCECNNVTIKFGKAAICLEEKLISKKKLLEKYGISYGALYRWKRKGLIPDEWFIKKSTVTGQETFFPEELITKRVETILSMKDEVLLDELAKKLSGEELTHEYILISTAFGERKINISDINSIVAVSKNGERLDVTESLKKLFTPQEEEKSKKTGKKGGIFSNFFKGGDKK